MGQRKVLGVGVEEEEKKARVGLEWMRRWRRGGRRRTVPCGRRACAVRCPRRCRARAGSRPLETSLRRAAQPGPRQTLAMSERRPTHVTFR
eukprot:1565540-Rhodomonas_salina.2